MDNETTGSRTTCLVVGGGPAGVMFALLMARAGVQVTVLEKHADFLRDFRGDTVHASTMNVLDELGLGGRFAAIANRFMDRMQVQLDSGTARIADMRRVPGRHKHIALVPQEDLLNLLAAAAAEEPSFTLRRDAEVTGLIHEGGRVAGVRWTDRVNGEGHEMRATLTVACDGRGSVVREAAGLVARDLGSPMDVWWLRLDRQPDDLSGGIVRLSPGQTCVMLDRDDYWQCAYVIRKGSDQELRAEGLDALSRRIRKLLPWLGEQRTNLQSLDQVKLLDVKVNRLDRWYSEGLLLIGDAAHAMSPIGGIGVNLAIADGVAAARIVAPVLRRAPDRPVAQSVLKRVQRRRMRPTAILQGIQLRLHGALQANLERKPLPVGGPTRDILAPPPLSTLPRPLRLAQRFPVLQGIPARLVALGPRPEHAPRWARRSNATRARTAGT